MTRRVLALLAAMLVTACTVGPNYERPPVELPKDVGLPATSTQAADKWWTLFDDPALGRLVDEALAANRDLRAAAARVEQARSQFTIVRAEQFPQAGIEAERSRSRTSEKAGGIPLPPEAIQTDTYRVVLRASW